MPRNVVCVLLSLLLGACATSAPVFKAGIPCEADSFTVTDDFGGARRGRCEVLAKNHVRISIVPEDDGYINPSPWFSFRVIPETQSTAVISMQYVGAPHRYAPKISFDGQSWEPIDTSRVSVSDDEMLARIEVPLGDTAFWVSAQELLMPAVYDEWIKKTARSSDADIRLLGQSLEGLPIHYLETNPSSSDVLFLVGRQHPPEVSGSFAFFSFLETLLADTETARAFRDRFQIVAIPLLNPDGVLDGNWRHNLGSTDLNRDWGIFKQPETRAAANMLDRLDADGDRIRVFLDFHSTDRNLFYTQDETVPTTPPHFFEAWFTRATPRLENYSFTNEAGPGVRPTAARNYMYRRYGIPSATYEVGDETDRKAARQAAMVFAEELMALMLETLAETR